MEKMEGWAFIRLIHALRQVSLAISTEEVYEAQTCLTYYQEIPPKEILRALLVRRPQDVDLFENVWKILKEQFSLSEKVKGSDGLNTGSLSMQDRIGIGGLGLGRGWGGVSLTKHGVLNDELNALKPMPYSRLLELVNGESGYEDAIKLALTEMNYFSWINAHDLVYQRGELAQNDWILHQDLRVLLVKTLQEHVLAAFVNQENSWLPIQRQYWKFKPLSTLTDDEKRVVKESIQKWARRLALRSGGRWKRKHKGSLDTSRLVQQSVQGAGKLFYLSYRQRVPKMSELVVCCDVSNSVASYVEFLLYMVGCLRLRFRKMRVFLFIDTIWEVEGFEWKDDIEGLMLEIKSWAHKESSGFSDYGKVFRELVEAKLYTFSSRATFLLLGDGKNNYRPAQAEYLAQISDKVRKVYWLNPLKTEEWKDPDNALKYYQEHCTNVYSCRTALDLQRIVQGVL